MFVKCCSRVLHVTKARVVFVFWYAWFHCSSHMRTLAEVCAWAMHVPNRATVVAWRTHSAADNSSVPQPARAGRLTTVTRLPAVRLC